ncbi:MAG: histidine kinase dimerization/phosphoacceptor domain-containing protein, partial [Actinomycetota bacterium]|nr:histidine kinase dimerization/phosphoacceptor domain-containing protein [Actinomycetota bacterium]
MTPTPVPDATPVSPDRRSVAWRLILLGGGLSLVIVVFAVLGPGDEGSESAFGSGGVLGIVLLILPGVSFFTVGSLLAVRRAQNAVSWLCLVIGLIWLVIAATGAASQWAFFEGLTGLAEWLGVLGALWVPALGLMATHLPLRLPDGLLLSPRWKWFSRFCTLAIVLVTLGIGTAPGPVNGIAGTRNPVASEQLQVLEPAFALLLIAFLGAMAALVIRYRRSGGTQRLQLRVIAFGGFSFFLVFIVSLASLVGLVPEGSGLEQSLQSLAFLFYNAIPIAIAVAVFRYRLYDIDLVINKTLVFIVLAGFITAVYAGIVVGLGRLLPIGENDLGLAIAATALVAVAFEPVRVRVQHWANRRVYGRRATPYEALAAMTSRIGESADPGSALAEAARLLAQGTGAGQAVIWVVQDGVLIPRATAGDAPIAAEPVELVGAELPVLPGADLVQAVRQDGELVGALSLTKRPGEGVSSADRRLVEELAGQAALLLANTRLRSRLRDRLAELRASRQRMLAAQDRARRALERDLHDGAQQELVALKVKLGLARTIATREGAPGLAAQLAETALVADQAVDA